MTRNLLRTLPALLCALLATGGTLAVTAAPAAAMAPLTSFAIMSNDSTSVTGQSVILSVSLNGGSGSPTGTVDIVDGVTTICASLPLTNSGALSFGGCTVANLGVGVHAVTASYSGDVSYDPATSPEFSQSVSEASTTTVITSDPAAPHAGDTVTFTATVSVTSPGAGEPTGSVEFIANGVTIAGCAATGVVDGAATCATTALPGNETSAIDATYGGDASFLTSVAPQFSQNVDRAETTMALTSNAGPARFGEAVTLTATVTSLGGTPTGSVHFFVVHRDLSHEIIATVPMVDGTAITVQRELSVRTDAPIVAEYHGDADFGPSADMTNQTVFRSLTRTLMRSSANPSKLGRVVTLTVEVRAMGLGEGTPTGKVAFYRITDGVRRWIGTVALDHGIARLRTSKTPVGVSSMIARYNGNGSFRPSSRTGVQRVHAT